MCAGSTTAASLPSFSDDEGVPERAANVAFRQLLQGLTSRCAVPQKLRSPLPDFLTVNGDFVWGGNCQLHPVSAHRGDPYPHASANHNRFTRASAKNEH